MRFGMIPVVYIIFASHYLILDIPVSISLPLLAHSIFIATVEIVPISLIPLNVSALM